MADDLFHELNKTELVQMARSAGLGNVGHHLSRDEIIELIVDGEDADQDHLEEWRARIERHIFRNRKRLLSQLPGCNGKCKTYGCPDIIVTKCWEGFRRDML